MNEPSGSLPKNSVSLRAPATGGVRFAPSPTGRFHVGNLRTAWVSQLWAKHLGLPWIVRFEDIDRDRVIAGAREQQRHDLATIGLHAPHELLQSDFHARHFELFRLAKKTHQIYPCFCSRKEVQMAIASAPHDGLKPVYSGACRNRVAPNTDAVPKNETIAWRFKMPNASGLDDFMIARTLSLSVDSAVEFTPAYHWACAIDDYDGNYDLLVRSSDLLEATPVQRAIQTWIAKSESSDTGVTFRPPAVFHTSLIVQNDGHRLEKRTRGVTLDELLSHSLNIAGLLNRFRASFDLSILVDKILPGAISGEARATLKLRELLNLACRRP